MKIFPAFGVHRSPFTILRAQRRSRGSATLPARRTSNLTSHLSPILLVAALLSCVICLHGEKIRKVYEYGRIRDCKCRLERSRELGRVQTSDASLCRKIRGSLFGARRSFPGAGGKLESGAGRNRIPNGSTGEAMVQLRRVPAGARGSATRGGQRTHDCRGNISARSLI